MISCAPSCSSACTLTSAGFAATDGTETTVGLLTRGNYFGEQGLLTDSRRHFTVRAASDLTLLTVPDTHDTCFEDNTFGTFFSLIGLSAPPGCDRQK